jgi:hypothetical protein
VLETFTLQTFVPLRGNTFGLTSPNDGPVLLELAEARSLGAPPASARRESSSVSASPGGTTREPFSLTFAGPREPLLGQGTYTLSHPTLGEFDLFIVPVERDADGMRYEAVFT